MIRLLGAALVLGGGTALGLSAALRLRARAALLGRLTAALGLMETEMSFRLTPLPALLEQAAAQAGGALAEALSACRAALLEGTGEAFRVLWDTHVAHNARLPLRQEERRVLEELGGVLGRCGAESQALSLRGARARLDDYRARAEEEQGRQGRVLGTLGAAGGALLVLVLL